MAKILLVGEDVRLLETRSAVLAEISSDIALRTPFELFQDWPREEFDLVILGHTVRSPELHAVVAKVRDRWRYAKILRLESLLGQNPAVGEDAVAPVAPEALLERVREMLWAPSSRSRGTRSVSGRSVD